MILSNPFFHWCKYGVVNMSIGSPLTATKQNDGDAAGYQSWGMHIVIFLVIMQQDGCVMYARYLAMEFSRALVK